jgi:hypothetical protein
LIERVFTRITQDERGIYEAGICRTEKTGRPFVGEVPVPALQRGRVLVRTVRR